MKKLFKLILDLFKSLSGVKPTVTSTPNPSPSITGTMSTTPKPTVTPVPNPCNEVMISPNLTYDASSGVNACMQGAFVPYYGSTSELETTAFLSTGNCTPAPEGYYCNGVGYRFWSGRSFGEYTSITLQ